MNREKFLELIEKEYDGSVTVKTNEDEYIIEDGENFIGGFENTFMSETLGNVAYNSLISAANALYSFITSTLKEEITDVYFE